MSGFCIAVAPKVVASRSPSHASTGAGGRHRRSPTGGAANGIPANRNPHRCSVPRTYPAEVDAIVIGPKR